jgi:hypothetical protein
MNGMLEGHQKGRSDLYKKQATEFDKNFKAMTKKHEELRKKMEDAVKLIASNKQAGMDAAVHAAAESGSDIIKAMVRRGEVVRALQTLNDTVQGREAAFKLVLTEQDRAATRKAAADRDKDTADYRKQELGLRRERLDLDKEKAETKATKVTQQTMMAQRAVNALGGVASAVESIKELPAGTTTGMLPNLQTKDGMMNYVRNTVGRKIASREAEMLNTLFTGVGRNLASIEASGAATGLSELSKQMQSGTYINSGTDDPYKVALKLADIRRIAVENIRPAIESGLMPKGQAETASKLVERIETAIPFTTIDVVRAANAGKQTIGQTTEAAVRGGKSYKTEADAEKAFQSGTLKAGEKVIINGVPGTWE